MDVIRSNIQMFLMLGLWLITGMLLGPGYLVLISVTLILLKMNGLTTEIFIGFVFILLLSDNLENSVSFAKTYKNIYLVFLFLFLLTDLKQDKTYFVDLYKLFIPYFIMGIIGLLYSPVFPTSVLKLLSYILLFISVPNYVVKCYRENGTYFFRIFLYFLFFIVFFGIVIRYVYPDLAISHGGRLRGFFGNPNGLGIFLILTHILFVVITNKYDGLFTRQEKLVFHVVIWYAVIASGSRTALMAILLFHVFRILFKRSKFLGFIFLFLALLLTETFMVYFPKIIVSLNLQESLRMKTLEEGSGRTIAWAFAWENIQQSVLVGKGFGYDEHLMRDNFELLSKMGHQGGVHNTYLIMWLNTGIIGLISFLRGFFLLFFKASKKSEYAYPAMFAIMLSINFEPWLAASLNPFTILFLVLITILTEDIFNNDWNHDEEDIEMA